MNILLVDDDSLTRQMVAHVLRKDGHEVTSTGDPTDAIALARESSAEVVVTDWNMPGMSGIDLCRQVSDELSSDLPVVLLTANTDAESRETARNAGASALIGKPFNAGNLTEQIRRFDPAVRSESNSSVFPR